MTVGQLLASMDSSELAEWMAFDRLEPIGIEREDYNMARLTAAIINSTKGKGAAAQP